MVNFFAQLVGQDQAVELLTQAVTQNRVAPAYLFAGPDGVGRSLAARCFVNQLFCASVVTDKQQQIQKRLQLGNHPDLLWVEPTILHQGQRLTEAQAQAAGLKRKASPVIRTEQVREIAQFLSSRTLEAPRKVVVLEQAEKMAEAAANALLKTLEEPGQATLILIAPTTESLLPTLVSRCQRIPFYRLNASAIAQVLRQTGHEEILHAGELLAIAQGSPGKAITSATQLEAIPPELLDNLRQVPQSIHNALELARQIDKTLDMEAQLWLVDYLQHCYWQQFLEGAIMKAHGNKADAVSEEESISPRTAPEYSDRFLPPLQQLEKTRRYLHKLAQPRLVWEVTLLGVRG